MIIFWFSLITIGVIVISTAIALVVSKDYLFNLANEFRAVGKYKDITDTTGKTRCVTIDYEGDFHADLVPAIVNNGRYYICNKATNEFELTDGDGYADWFKGQDNIMGGNLIPAVRLLKFLRDYKDEFDTKSIILTTIAGMQASNVDAISASYKDIPTALTTLLKRINQFLSQFKAPPSIFNPAMPGENFDRHWKKEKKGFAAFQGAIQKYSAIAEQAIEIIDTDEQLKKWQELFGDKFEINGNTGSKESSNPYAGSGVGAIVKPQQPWLVSNV